MTRILAFALLCLILPTVQAAPCEWTSPGADRYTGSVPAAVASYQDIPEETRQRLIERVSRHDYDEVVTIHRDWVEGQSTYSADISQMHFGSRGRVCPQVSRSKWAPDDIERGLVYCESSTCILIPTVCTNVSRITRYPSSALLTPEDGALQLAPLDSMESRVTPLAYNPSGEGPSYEAFTGGPGGGWFTYYPPYVRGPGGGGSGGHSSPPIGPHIPPSPVPEPHAWMMLLAGGLVILIKRRVR